MDKASASRNAGPSAQLASVRTSLSNFAPLNPPNPHFMSTPTAKEGVTHEQKTLGTPTRNGSNQQLGKFLRSSSSLGKVKDAYARLIGQTSFLPGQLSGRKDVSPERLTREEVEPKSQTRSSNPLIDSTFPFLVVPQPGDTPIYQDMRTHQLPTYSQHKQAPSALRHKGNFKAVASRTYNRPIPLGYLRFRQVRDTAKPLEDPEVTGRARELLGEAWEHNGLESLSWTPKSLLRPHTESVDHVENHQGSMDSHCHGSFDFESGRKQANPPKPDRASPATRISLAPLDVNKVQRTNFSTAGKFDLEPPPRKSSAGPGGKINVTPSPVNKDPRSGRSKAFALHQSSINPPQQDSTLNRIGMHYV
ncbi:MAG: hypothetical protein M1814_001715 [Vezdaea aestivalis]|nr:MAG: hypothetical protein M1814_001715 [Vezdaea aestivalis]